MILLQVIVLTIQKERYNEELLKKTELTMTKNIGVTKKKLILYNYIYSNMNNHINIIIFV